MEVAFIHIPKTGGASIQKQFEGKIDYIGHDIKNPNYSFPNEDLNKEYDFIFCFIRNPIHRFTSAYNFILHGGRNKSDMQDRSILLEYGNINRFILEGSDDFIGLTHFIPQYKFIENIDCNYFLFEDFSKEVDRLCDETGLSYNKKYKIHKQDYSYILSKKSINKIKKIYKEDFDLYRNIKNEIWGGL